MVNTERPFASSLSIPEMRVTNYGDIERTGFVKILVERDGKPVLIEILAGKRMKLDLEKILKELKPYRERKAQIDPQHCALLAIDMQNYFQRLPQPVLKNILRVIQTCRPKNIPSSSPAWSYPSGFVWRNIREWWEELIVGGTEDWNFFPR